MLRWFLKVIFFIPFCLIYWTSVSNKRFLRQFRGKPVVIVSNHKSYLDPVAMFFRVHRRFGAIAKDYLFNVFFIGWVLRRVGVFPVGGGLSAIKTSLTLLKKNRALLIYPEGTRVADPDEALAIRNGASMIAIKAGVPVLPVVISRAPKPFRLTRIKYGEPISTDEFKDRKVSKDELTEFSNKVQAIMAGMLEGFEIKEKRKKWDEKPLDNVRAVVIRGVRIPDVEGGGTRHEMLFMRRTKPHYRNGVEYFVTPGGHIDEGESPTDACVREVMEETGIEVKTVRTLYKHTFKSGKVNEMQATYLCEYLGGEIIINKDSEEYQDGVESQLARDGKVKGTFEPMWVNIERLYEKDFDLRSPMLKKQLAKDIKARGVQLVRSVKLLK